jgi:phenylpropionate dioxygenase-like ring-hydroxylating dioxygenase large terminal subunit
MEETPMLGAKATGRHSVYRALPYWYVACSSRDLGGDPLQARIWDTPLVLFRDGDGAARCLLDRCAHRNVPLSGGARAEGGIQCPYHGWIFDGEGRCTRIPALCGTSEGRARVPSFPVREQQGYVWVFTSLDTEPSHSPYLFPHLEDPAYSVVRYEADFEGTLHATAENILDVPHTAYLHKGLFRGGDANEIGTVVRRYSDRAECEYVGEPRPTGLMGRLLAPGGGDVEHFDRFILPSIAQVEYRLGGKELMTTSALTPISSHLTRMNAVVTVKMRPRIPLLQSVVTPFAMKVVRQDKEMLALQSRWAQQFGGEQYIFTEADTLGPTIARLLKRASEEAIQVLGVQDGDPEAVIRAGMMA